MAKQADVPVDPSKIKPDVSGLLAGTSSAIFRWRMAHGLLASRWADRNKKDLGDHGVQRYAVAAVNGAPTRMEDAAIQIDRAARWYVADLLVAYAAEQITSVTDSESDHVRLAQFDGQRLVRWLRRDLPEGS